MEQIQTLLALLAKWWPAITAIIAACAAVAAITPSRSDDRIIQIIIDIVNKLGLNVGKAKNADA